MRLIAGSKTDYITPTGKVYKDYGNNMFYPKKASVNNHNGYMYIGITYYKNGNSYNKSRRLHKVLAETYLPNPNNYPIVMHLDNNKQHNTLNNLKWGTVSENTKQAFNDGLAKNAKGYEDSQSIPVIMFDVLTRKELKRFGSMCEAAKNTGIDLGIIRFQISNHTEIIKSNVYFRYEKDGNIDPPRIVIQYDYDTDKEISRHINIATASIETGIKANTISSQCYNNVKSKYRPKSGTYFLFK